MARFLLAIGLIAVLCYAPRGWAENPKSIPLINTIAVSGNADTPLYLATRNGLYLARSDGKVKQLAYDKVNITAIAIHNGVIYAGGHSNKGENIGLVISTDNGKAWNSNTTPGHFSALTVGKNGNLYGLSNGVVRSFDGGKTWQKTVQVKENIYNIAASKTLNDTLYITMDSGLLVSRDAGVSWHPVFKDNLPALALTATSKGKLWVYIAGKGLIGTNEASPQLRMVYNGFGKHVPMQAAVDEANNNQLYLLEYKGKVWFSQDDGKIWDRLGGIPQPQTAAAKRGEKLYNQYCVVCHGQYAVGESYSLQSLTDQNYIMAPALDGSAHAWHHTDEQLTEMILKGSPRTDRMPPWEHAVNQQQAMDIIHYFKGFWGERELECQGPKHMNCPH